MSANYQGMISQYPLGWIKSRSQSRKVRRENFKIASSSVSLPSLHLYVQNSAAPSLVPRQDLKLYSFLVKLCLIWRCFNNVLAGLSLSRLITFSITPSEDRCFFCGSLLASFGCVCPVYLILILQNTRIDIRAGLCCGITLCVYSGRTQYDLC
jgi:hypothetical protein